MSIFQHLHLDTDTKRIAWLTLDAQDNPGNTLTPDVWQELALAVTHLATLSPAGLVVRSAKPGVFSAGSDVASLQGLETYANTLAYFNLTQRVCQQLTDLPCPTVAMLEGNCWGSGLELALACRFRLACDDPYHTLGFTETRLGLHPYCGSTLRAIDTLGFNTAMELMLSGKHLTTAQARQIGLIDNCVPSSVLHDTAIHYLSRPVRTATPSLWHTATTRLTPARRVMAASLRTLAARYANPAHYTAPVALVALWEKHGGNPGDMLAAETLSAAQLLQGSVARKLLWAEALRQRLQSAGDPDILPRPTLCIVSDTPHGQALAEYSQQRQLEVNLLHPEQLSDRLLAEADVILETTDASLTDRQALLASLEKCIRPDALLATHTTCMTLENLAGQMQQRQRLVGLHVCTPLQQRELVEVVYDAHEYHPHSLQQALALVHQLGKLPLPVHSIAGFVVTRMLWTFVQEGIRLHQQGIPASIIDQAAREAGMAQGPLEMADADGIAHWLQTCNWLAKNFQGEVPPILQHMVQAGKTGQAAGAGFYTYCNGRLLLQEPEAWSGNRSLLQQRLLLPLLATARQCLEEGVVEDADLLDAGMLFGAGVQPFSSSLLHNAST